MTSGKPLTCSLDRDVPNFIAIADHATKWMNRKCHDWVKDADRRNWNLYGIDLLEQAIRMRQDRFEEKNLKKCMNAI